MSRKRVFGIGAGLLGVALAFGLGVAVGQQAAPTESKGVKFSPPTALDLSQEIDGVAGRQLRLRVVTLDPGGVVALHSHKGRPAVAYVHQGEPDKAVVDCTEAIRRGTKKVETDRKSVV